MSNAAERSDEAANLHVAEGEGKCRATARRLISDAPDPLCPRLCPSIVAIASRDLWKHCRSDARPLLDASIGLTVSSVLDRFDDPDAHVVGIAAAESGTAWVDDDRRAQVFELFRWYRRGTGL